MSNIIQTFPKGGSPTYAGLPDKPTVNNIDIETLSIEGMDVADNSGTTEISAPGLNADSLADVTSGEVGNNFATSAFNYSTNEQIVGKWINGKPIYQKTFIYSSSGGDTEWSSEGIALTTSNNIKDIISCDTTFMWENNWQSAPYYEVENDMDKVFVIVNGTTHNLFLFHKIKTVANVNVYATIQFTKTTDT